MTPQFPASAYDKSIEIKRAYELDGDNRDVSLNIYFNNSMSAHVTSRIDFAAARADHAYTRFRVEYITHYTLDEAKHRRVPRHNHHRNYLYCVKEEAFNRIVKDKFKVSKNYYQLI